METAFFVQIVKAYFYDAADRLNKIAKDAINSFAEGDESKMMLMGLKRFTKIEAINPKMVRQAIALMAIEKNEYPL